MSWKAKLYRNTGFNAVNTPGNLNILETNGNPRTITDLEIIQPFRLDHIDVEISYNDAMKTDYLYIWSDTDTSMKAYYSVDDFEALSEDVYRLSITMDYTLTYMALNGLTNVGSIRFLDGVTVRHHVSSSHDTYGAYTEEDPLLIPSKELIMDTTDSLLEASAGSGDPGHAVIESTLNLTNPGTSAVTYTDPDTGQTATATNMDTVQTHGVCNIPNPETGVSANVVSPVTEYYDYAKPEVKTGVKKAINLNMQSGLVNSWRIPNAAIQSYTVNQENKTVTLVGADREVDTGLNFLYASVHNKRCLYGNTTQYKMYSTASGSSAIFKPEDIAFNGNTQLTSPHVRAIYDLRADGRPYFRFKYYKGDDSNFFMNCIPGQQWEAVPLTTGQKTGITQDTINFNTNQNIENQDYANMYGIASMNKQILQHQYDLANPKGLFGQLANTASVSGGLNVVGNALTQAWTGINPARAAAEDARTSALMANQSDINALNMKQSRINQERQQFQLSSNFTTPEVFFPRSNTIRDVVGNGLRVTRIRPAQSDLNKFDKILTMYGYRITEAINSNMLDCRSKFCYIEAKGVSVEGTSPRWLKDGVAAEFSIGKRFWHVAPNSSYYTNGQNT